MRRYVVRRLLLTLIAFLAGFTLVFAGVDAATPESDIWGFPQGLDPWPSNVVERYATYLWDTIFGTTLTGYFSGFDSALSEAWWNSVLVGLLGSAVGVGVGCLVWLVLHARLPRWFETGVTVAFAGLGGSVLVWLLPSVQRALEPDLGPSAYYLHWPRFSDAMLNTSFEGVVRASLLVGLALGGAVALALFVMMRRDEARTTGDREADRSLSSPGSGGLTWRRAWARALGVWWPLQVFCGLVVVALVLLAERAALYDGGIGFLYSASWRSSLLVTGDLWLALFTAAILIALALGLVAVALDPSIVDDGARGEVPRDKDAPALDDHAPAPADAS